MGKLGKLGRWELAIFIPLLVLMGCSADDAMSTGEVVKNAAPTPASVAIVSFVWQTDGVCGVRMLRPKGWASSRQECRSFSLHSSAEDRLELTVINYQLTSEQIKNGSIVQYALFEQDSSLEGWTQNIENSWGNIGIQFTLLNTLPYAKVYSLEIPASTNVEIAALLINQNQPLGLSLIASGSYASLERLQKEGLVDDFLTMLESVEAIPHDPQNLDPIIEE